ncbi:hypothetical protein GCM10010211_71420 [Streptomyces albospinus]|uniref:Uncharacterized protein n=1 Tax=Streptomyces albospinus TaxID=285515 RepID=A0ABQ2VMX0_9ACTN|nr:hypothetical protein GCM10010211_71420 [Streptomyces albospinus]
MVRYAMPGPTTKPSRAPGTLLRRVLRLAPRTTATSNPTASTPPAPPAKPPTPAPPPRTKGYKTQRSGDGPVIDAKREMGIEPPKV